MSKYQKALKALDTVDRLITYPVDTSIQRKGYACRRDADTIEYAMKVVRQTLKELRNVPRTTRPRHKAKLPEA